MDCQHPEFSVYNDFMRLTPSFMLSQARTFHLPICLSHVSFSWFLQRMLLLTSSSSSKLQFKTFIRANAQQWNAHNIYHTYLHQH